MFTTVVQTFASSPAGVESTRPMYRGAVVAFFAASDVQEMTDALLNLVERSCTAIAERKRSHNALLYQQIQDLVNRSLEDSSLYIPSIAEAFSLHPKYLSHFFKEQRGVGLAEYIREQRILRSQSLLTRNLPIREVAKKVGYSSVTTFNRAFRQQTGMTPSAYKEQQRLAALSEAPQRRDAQQNDT